MPKPAEQLGILTLSLRLARAGRPEEALDTARESVRVRRDLLPTDDREVLHGLVASLNNLGIRLRALDRHDEAAEVAREAVERCRALTELEPAYRSRLADAPQRPVGPVLRR